MNGSEACKNQLRLERILNVEIEFIESDEFESMLTAQTRPGIFETVPLNRSPKVQDDVQAENLPCLAPALGEPLLSFAEEQHEFRRMNFLKFQAARLQLSLDANRPDEKTLNQIERLLSEAKHVRDHIIRSNMRLVVSNAGKYCTSSYGFEDLVSDGSLSLMEAVEKFNYQLGFRFSTYATHAIRRSFFRRIERKQKDRKRFSVTDPEIMMSTPDQQEVDYDAPAENRLMAHMVEVMSDHLTERERQIIEGRFGLNGRSEPLTLMQLSAKLGICKERVRQVEGAALKKLHAVAVEYSKRQLASSKV
ncbi:MAG: sigma-70 family RNA polymerase sigma factor [Schlesneria sp.]